MESRKIKILAIDDNMDNLITINALILESFPDALVLTSTTGKKGLELAHLNNPDVILLDIVMPGMDGFDVCRKLKGDKTLSDIPVVFVTAIKGDKDSRIMALECGAEAFLSKPIDESELKAQIRAMIKIKHANIAKRNENERLSSLVAQRTLELENELAERKRVEDALRKSEEQYRSVSESANDAIVTADHKGMIIGWNKGAEKIFGYTSAEILGNNLIEIMPENYAGMHAKGLELHIKGRQPQVIGKTIELHGLHKSGNTFPLELSLAKWETSENTFYTGIIRDTSDRKKADEKISMLAHAIRSIGECVSITDLQNKILFVNHAFLETYQYEENEVLGKSIDLIKSSKNPTAMVQEILNDTIKGQWHGELINRRKDGSEFPVFLSTSVIRDEKNNPLALIGVATDITERKQVQEALKVSEDKYRTMIEYSNDLIWTLDKNGNFTFFNEIASTTAGLNFDEWIGKSFIPLILEEDLPFILDIFQKSIHGQACNYELRFKKPDGSILTISVNTSPIYISGNIVGVVSFGRDITAQKIAEKRILLNTFRLNALYELSLMANVSEKDLYDFVLDKSVAFSESEIGFLGFVDEKQDIVNIYAWSKKAMKQCDVKDFSMNFSIENAGIWAEPIKKKQHVIINDYKAPHPQKRGTPEGHLNVKNYASIPYFDGDKIVAILAVSNKSGNYDISDVNQLSLFMDGMWKIIKKREYENELIVARNRAEESDRLKSAFLANMSHEIRTPMNGILGFSELLKKPGLSGDQQQEYIGIIKKSGDRMLNIINDIIDISKIEAGLIEVNSSETNLNEQMEYVYSFFKPQTDKKRILLTCINGLPTKKARIYTDKAKINSILTNLVKNAVKYSESGCIEFGYLLKEIAVPYPNKLALKSGHEAIKHELEFFVKDTGIGIPSNRIHAIFDRFVQADIADTRAFQGAGLGLSIAKAYVEILGGKIRVSSEEEKGSTFYFTIPYLSVKNETSNEITLDNSTPDQIKKLKILIVEDDKTSEMLLKIVLSKFSDEILEAKTGAEAIAICRKNTDIDLILMDVKMPEMDGYEATRAIRKFNKNVIIIAQTAYGLKGDIEKSIAAGCNNYISKPIEIPVLNSLLLFYGKKQEI